MRVFNQPPTMPTVPRNNRTIAEQERREAHLIAEAEYWKSEYPGELTGIARQIKDNIEISVNSYHSTPLDIYAIY